MASELGASRMKSGRRGSCARRLKHRMSKVSWMQMVSYGRGVALFKVSLLVISPFIKV